MTTHPYRGPATTPCPVCAAPLPAAAAAPQPCAAGCGEWASAAVIEDWWGDVIDVGVPVARVLWRPPPPARACAVCRGPMTWISNEAWTVHRCRLHGAWFERDGRGAFESAHAAAIDVHRWARHATQAHATARARARHDLRELLARAVAGDAVALDALADRLARVEVGG